MKRPLRAATVTLSVFAALAIASVALAASYSASFTITETSSNSYTMLAVQVSADCQYLVDNGYILATALDTRVETESGSTKPHMVVDDRILAASAVPADSQTNLSFTTGNSALSSMDIILGDGGYMSEADDADLELGNNFSIGIDAYLDTEGYGVAEDYYLVFKQESIAIFQRSSGELVGVLYSQGNVKETPGGNNLGGVIVNSSNWFAQTFTATGDYDISSVDIYGLETGTCTGTANVEIRTVAGGLPTSTILSTGSIAASDFPAGAAYTNIPLTPCTISNGITYALVLNDPDDTGGNYVNWKYDNGNPYAGGQECSSNDSGASWTAVGANDLIIKVYGDPVYVTDSGISAGEHDIVVAADGVNLTLTIDSVEEDSMALGGISATNNAYSWYLLISDTIPYANYYKHTIGGTLIAHYQPITMIIGTTMPDRETGASTENATITFGSNPAGVSVALGSLTSDSQAAAGGEEDTATRDVLPAAGASDWFTEPDVTGALLTNPLRPFVTIMSDTTSLTEMQAWRLLGLAFVLGLTALVVKAMPNHLAAAGVTACVTIGACVALTIFPLWALVFAIGAIIGGLVAERSPAL